MYEIVEDRLGDLYCSINLKWNYNKCYVDLDMSKYVMKQMTCYAHPVLSNHNIVPTLPIPSLMVKTIKLRHIPKIVPSWMPLVRSAYNKSLEVSSIMPVLSTPPY